MMVRSSIIPLCFSFRTRQEFILTPEVLDSFDLILLDSDCVEAFEAYLAKNDYLKTVDGASDYNASDLLQFYLNCVICLDDLDETKDEHKIEKFLIENKGFLRSEIGQDLDFYRHLDKLSIETVKRKAFHKLEEDYYPEFKESYEFRQLAKRIVQQQIYISEAYKTSIMGVGDGSNQDISAVIQRQLNDTRYR